MWMRTWEEVSYLSAKEKGFIRDNHADTWDLRSADWWEGTFLLFVPVCYDRQCFFPCYDSPYKLTQHKSRTSVDTCFLSGDVEIMSPGLSMCFLQAHEWQFLSSGCMKSPGYIQSLTQSPFQRITHDLGRGSQHLGRGNKMVNTATLT